MDARLKKNVHEGLLLPTKHKVVISASDLGKISMYLFDQPNPINLRLRVWFILGIRFFSEGCRFHVTLKLNSFVLKKDENGLEYMALSNSDGPSGSDLKENRIYGVPDAGEMCPVKSIQLLIAKTNPKATSLFNSCMKASLAQPEDMEFWYSDKPAKLYQFTRYMQEISKKAGCDNQTYSANCLRASALHWLSNSTNEIHPMLLMMGYRK